MVLLEDANNHRDMLLARVQALQREVAQAGDVVQKLMGSLEAGEALAVERSQRRFISISRMAISDGKPPLCPHIRSQPLQCQRSLE